jgi:hypothetical protein
MKIIAAIKQVPERFGKSTGTTRCIDLPPSSAKYLYASITSR